MHSNVHSMHLECPTKVQGCHEKWMAKQFLDNTKTNDKAGKRETLRGEVELLGPSVETWNAIVLQMI